VALQFFRKTKATNLIPLNELVLIKVENMSQQSPHKFKEKMELTYEQYWQNRFCSVVNLAKALEHAFGKDRTFEIIRKWNEESATESVKSRMSKKPIKNFEDFKRFFKNEYGSRFWTHVLTLDYPQETSKKLSCHVTECLAAKTFREMNATDLGYILCCHPDFAMARAYHPKLRLKRTKTLMQGDTYCNHTYYWKE
jgi:hypothetical protein